ncbi:LAFA_0G01992g1_1 [Lachancea sp. 'fantastica']|nr:LAFA_0G01992g1_1 [Lachancea sp. 'fantastica']
MAKKQTPGPGSVILTNTDGLGRRGSTSQRRWMRSLSPVGKLYHSSASLMHFPSKVAGGERSSLAASDGEESNTIETGNRDLEPDLACPRGMAKSIVGLLTTASVYAGMGDMEQAAEICEDDSSAEEEGDDSTVSKSAKNKEQHEHDANEENQELELEPSDNVSPHGDENSTASDSAIDLDSLTDTVTHVSKKDTLFEISVEPNHDATSVVSTSSGSRQLKIYRKLLSRFNLNEAEDEFVLRQSCWLLKDLLIQGHIVLTSRHVLFFAFLPKSTGTAKMSGNLSTFSGGLRGRWSRYWAVLKDHTLSLYNSRQDLYFPLLTIDLRYASRIELDNRGHGATGTFRICTEAKTYKFRADSHFSSRSWSSALKKQLFATHNSENDSMSVKIPLVNILDVEEQMVVAQSVTLRIRVLESPASFAVDDYFFMFLGKSEMNLRQAINAQLSKMEKPPLRQSDLSHLSPPVTELNDGQSEVLDKTARGRSDSNSRKIIRRVLSPVSKVRRPSFPVHVHISQKYPQRALSLLKSKNESESSTKTSSDDTFGGLSHHTLEDTVELGSPQQLQVTADEISDSDESAQTSEDNKLGTSKLASWTPRPIKNMGSMWGAHPVHYRHDLADIFPDDDQYLANAKDQLVASKRFKSHFSLKDDEILRAAYYTHLNKNIPVYGKLYIGTSVICFRSLIPGNKTKMILPIEDLENCYKERGFRFGYFGLVLVIHGHEELFFEFSLPSSRDDAEYVTLKQLDLTKLDVDSPITTVDGISQKLRTADISAEQKATDAGKLRLFEDKINAEGFDLPMMVEESPFYKTSITPKKSYRFGLLTIGSRGDVQPYIALAKGLLKEGHRVTIISHSEFGSWVRSYGIKFREIAGNPAELMSLMVQHGSMNVGLLREASSKFRDWISQLLRTSWQACQNLDILIESPSAMAGIHIAEALQIPYFRAFTMPWTRTRAYPHAFIVPDQKRGGNYNFFTHVLFENIFWKGIGGQVNKWRIETLGLKKTNLMLMQQNKVPFLYNISPAVFPPSVDFSEWIKVTGYWFLDGKDDYSPPKALADFIAQARGQGKKLVYIGFGSIVINNPKKMTKAVVDAVLEADVFCILNKGWSDRLDDNSSSDDIEEPFPECIYSSGSVPHDWLFPQIDAAVHHGGSGTTGATLRAGLPTIIKPFFGDQFFYAGRVEDIGAGINLKKLNSKTLSRALKEVTTSSRMSHKAQQIQQEIAKEDGVETAISCIYSELEYAKSLVQAKYQEKQDDMKDLGSPEENSWFLV